MSRGPSVWLLVAMTGLIAWPALLADGETWPATACVAVVDAWERIALAGRLFHDLKNLLTELFRCDPQWWAKLASFVWTVETIVILSLAAWVISSKRGRK